MPDTTSSARLFLIVLLTNKAHHTRLPSRTVCEGAFVRGSRIREHVDDVVHTATSTLANGASHPSTEQFVRNIGRNIGRLGYDTGVDVARVEEVAERLRYIARREDKPGFPAEV